MSSIHITKAPYELNSHLIIHIPKEASAELPSRGQVMVKGTLNGHAFHTALEPDGNWSHWLDVTKKMQEAAEVAPGKSAELIIEATKEWPEPEIPADVQAGLADDPEIKPLWDAVTPMARWEWLRWINATSNPATRKIRIEKSQSKLKSGLRRPCCFNRNMCCVPDVSKSGVLLDPTTA